MRLGAGAGLIVGSFLWVGIAYADTRPLEVQKVADGIYALVGELGQRSPANLGNNATFGVILTSDGVVLIDSGGSAKGAERIHRAIQRITDRPVVLVINSGGQDHRWLGNGYFKQLGARIVASEAAVADQQARASDQLTALDNLVGKAGMAGTSPVHADESFAESLDLTVGGVRMQVRNPGAAHTPGDSYVWLPDKRIAFSGDIVYVERILGVIPVSKSRSWIKSFDEIAALQPESIVPGHGRVANLTQARADTYDYLVELRKAVRALIDRGGGMEAVGTIDQSRFRRLRFFDELKGRNAQQVYQEMEWE